MRRPARLAALVALLAGLPDARAHFVLESPACVSEQNFLGDPQKSAPCGLADPGNPPVETGLVTHVQSGTTLDITIRETIFHPGHYRVLLAPSADALPDDPVVTPGATPCGSTVIDDTPELPLLADGLLVHTSALSGPQTMTVTIPADFTCDSCVLQVAEFMSDHDLNVPGGCWYHHCATLKVTVEAPPEGGNPTTPASCQCGAASLSGVLLLALARRRPRATRRD